MSALVTTTISKPKRKRTDLTLTQKETIVSGMIASGWSLDQLSAENMKKKLVKQEVKNMSAQYGVVDKTIKRIMEAARRAKICVDNPSEATKPELMRKTIVTGDSKRKTSGQLPEVEEKLFAWIERLRRHRIVLQRGMVVGKAEEVAGLMGMQDKLKFSEGWYSNFKRRYNLNKAQVPQFEESHLNRTRELLSEYSLENVFCMDETCLFFKETPSCTRSTDQAQGGEGSQSDDKAVKPCDRITLISCTNATGTIKVPLVAVGADRNPRSFVGSSVPLIYRYHKHAWMDSAVQEWWYENVFVKHVKEVTRGPVALVMDKFGAHDNVTTKDDVTVYLLPKDSTVILPTAAGLNAALKDGYREKLLTSMLRKVAEPSQYAHVRDEGKKRHISQRGLLFGYEPHLLDVARLCAEVWDGLSAEMIHNCWQNSSCLPIHFALDPPAKAKLMEMAKAKKSTYMELMTHQLSRLDGNYQPSSHVREVSSVHQKALTAWLNIEMNPDVVVASATLDLLDLSDGEQTLPRLGDAEGAVVAHTNSGAVAEQERYDQLKGLNDGAYEAWLKRGKELIIPHMSEASAAKLLEIEQDFDCVRRERKALSEKLASEDGQQTA